MSQPAKSLLRQIPKVDEFLATEPLQALLQDHSRPLVLQAVRALLDDVRGRGVAGELTAEELAIPALACLLYTSDAADEN